MMKSSILPFLLLVTVSECFVPNLHVPTTKRRERVTTMAPLQYFDDVSRRRFQSSSSSSSPMPMPATSLFQNVTFATTGFQQSSQNIRTRTSTSQLTAAATTITDYHYDKLETLQRTLFGHDFKSASMLSIDEMDQIMNEWFEKVDFCSEFLNDADAAIVVDIDNDSSTLIGCYAGLWERISSKSMSISMSENHNHNHNHNQMELILFPHCPELYKYDNMARIMKNFKACEDICSIFGKDVSISAFHPTFENEPRMFHAARHSPFPCFGLQVHAYPSSISSSSAQNEWNSNIPKPKYGTQKDDEEEEINAMFSDYMDQTRNELEALFQSAAATSKLDLMGTNRRLSSNDGSFLSSDKDEDTDTDEYFVSAMKDWINEQQKRADFDENGGEINQSLQYVDTINDDSWVVSHTALEEALYREVWAIIHQRLIQADQDASEKDESATSSLMSSVMFIPPKFAMYNAQKFKRFAISINRTLKQSSDGRAFIGELFHPEFVGANDIQSKSRRSPFPALLVVFA